MATCEKCGGGGWVLHPNPDARSWMWCECHPDAVREVEGFLRRIVGGLKSAADAHPEIQFASLEPSIAKRVLGALRARYREG